jgi:chromate transporter
MRPQPSLTQLFLSFATIGLLGFGGVLGIARKLIVEDRGWMTAEEFNETYALCSFLPGPNIVNMSVMYGARVRGPVGSAVALGALLGPPVALTTVLGMIYVAYGDLPAVRHAIGGLSAAAAGLIAATFAKMAKPLFHGRALLAPALMLATFTAIGIMRWPLPSVLLVLVPLSVALAFLRRQRDTI